MFTFKESHTRQTVKSFSKMPFYQTMHNRMSAKKAQKNTVEISTVQTEKEGFEPSRRDYRPTPLAGAPLQPLEYFSSRRFLYRQQELVYQFVAIMSTIFLNFIAFFYKFILYSISIYNFHSLLQYIDVFLFHFIL